MSLSRTITLGLLASLLVANAARSSTIVYGTAGVVLPFGGQTGPSAVSFEGVPNGARFTDSNPFSIGDFKVTPSADGSTTDYSNTPFLVQLSGYAQGVEHPLGAVSNSILIFGRLNGSVSNSSPSTIVATIDAVQPGIVPPLPPGFPFPVLLPFDPSTLVMARDTPLTSAGSGTTTLIGGLVSTPEPATLAIFGVVAAFIGLRHRRLSSARS